uniref:Uncharacterized protein n=1 Tax=Biomphalaria glabrata TaxID=6526 RepID=A0A2C9KM45_BIOGL
MLSHYSLSLLLSTSLYCYRMSSDGKNVKKEQVTAIAIDLENDVRLKCAPDYNFIRVNLQMEGNKVGQRCSLRASRRAGTQGITRNGLTGHHEERPHRASRGTASQSF